MRLCTVETSLYLDFFGPKNENGDTKKENNTNKATPSKTSSSKKDATTLASHVMSNDGTYYDASFQAFLDNLCQSLHRTIRRGLVSILDLDSLCQIVSVLREEQSLASASPTTMAAARTLGKIIVDSQERLIFSANSALGKEVLRFKALPTDLDYPEKLRKCRELQRRPEEKKDDTQVIKIKALKGVDISSEMNKEEEQLQLQMQIYESWFPPIRSVLKVLSKIFRVVESKVFEDIALTSVQACAKSLKDGSIYVEQKSGVLHSDLFLVKHLLILREQLSPFDIQLRSVERQLDFSHAGKAVSRFLANRNRQLFSMTTENALVTLLCEGVSTREASIDSKRDLEDALRSACNDFIEHTTVMLAGPIITFVEQCKSASVTGSAPLDTQSFLSGDYVSAIVNRALDRLEPEMGELTTQMTLYMDNQATQGILLKPVIRKITRIVEEAKRFITKVAVDGNEAWATENGNKKDEVFRVLSRFEDLIKNT